MHALVRTVFSRLHDLNPEIEEAKLRTNDEDAQESEIKMTVSTQDIPSQEDAGTQEIDVEADIEEDLDAVPTPSTSSVYHHSECECLDSGIFIFLLTTI